MSIHAVVAVDLKYGFAKNGNVPWKLPSDMRFFKVVTSNTVDQAKRNGVIMGRITWETIPPKFRPLTNRINVVLTSKMDSKLFASADAVFNNLSSAVNWLRDRSDIESIFVIGGKRVYEEALTRSDFSRFFITHVLKDYECDRHIVFDSSKFKQINSKFASLIPNYKDLPENNELSEENGIPFKLCCYQMIQHD